MKPRAIVRALSTEKNESFPAPSSLVRGISQAMSIKYNSMVYRLRQQNKPVLVMSLGEAYFDLPLFPMDTLPFPDSYHYSDSRGIPALRERIAEYYTTRYQAPVDPAREILITAGSKLAIYMGLLSILNEGDEVLIPEPAWVSYNEQIRLCRGIPVGIPYTEGPREYHRYLSPRTRALILTNPHNPRGYIYSRAELLHLLQLAEDNGLWLLCDEAYSDFARDGEFVSLGSLAPEKRNVLLFNSISKNYGISGWRLGHVIGRAEIIDEILKVNQHILTCPATILQHYVSRHFHDILEVTRPQIAELLEKRRALEVYLTELGLHVLPGSATFYFFLSIAPSRLTSEEFCTRLLETEGIATVPGIGYGASCDQFIRISIGTAPMADLKQGLVRIRNLIEATK